jgi:phage gp36-like protein
MSRYATYEDFTVFGMPETELAGTGLNEGGVSQFLEAAAGLIDSMIDGPNYTAPLLGWGTEITQVNCTLAAYMIRAGRVGFNPDGDDANYRLMYNDAIAWLKFVRENGGLVGVVDSTENVDEQQADRTPEVFSLPARGW